MPTMTDAQRDALDDAVSRQLFRINNVVRGMFGDELSDDELRSAYDRIMQGVHQAMQAQAAQQSRAGLPLGRSRIAGDVNLSLSGSKISNLPADPRDQTLQHPMFRPSSPSRVSERF